MPDFESGAFNRALPPLRVGKTNFPGAQDRDRDPDALSQFTGKWRTETNAGATAAQRGSSLSALPR